MIQLEVRPEFRDKIPPLSADEYFRLEANILEDGEVREPIVVWGNVIIDGHNRWKIIQAHPEIPFDVKQMNFANKWAAIVWMCHNQMGRRNMTDEQKTVLIGEAYKAQKMNVGNHTDKRDEGGKYLCAHDEHKGKGRTSELLAKEFGVAKETVKRSEHFLDGLNAAEEVSPGIKDAILSGEVKAPKGVIARIRNIPEGERPAAVEAIKRGDTAIAAPKAKKRGNKPEGYSKQMREENEIISKVVGEMYDTDRVVVHTVDHLLEDLDCLIKDFIKKINTSLEIFSETLNEDGAREKVCAALKGLEDEIKKIGGRVQ